MLFYEQLKVFRYSYSLSFILNSPIFWIFTKFYYKTEVVHVKLVSPAFDESNVMVF